VSEERNVSFEGRLAMVAAKVVDIDVAHVHAIEQHATSSTSEKRGTIGDGGLAGTGRAHDRDRLPPRISRSRSVKIGRPPW